VDLASGTVTRLTNAAVTEEDGSGYAVRYRLVARRVADRVHRAGDDRAELWVMSADGSQKRQLTNAEEAHALEPTWAPDGSVIAFSRVFRQSPQSLLMTVNPDGSNLTTIGGRLVSVAATPAYSPDGRWLTTSQTRGSGTGAVYAFSIAANAGPRIVMPEQLGGGRHARWMRKP
jgi:dipeptidyl aminopeptidase/acylaminoacyl peptidase